VLPAIVANKGGDDIIRIWVPGCATGEEAYSLAILLTELLMEKGQATQFQIFATDLSEKAINKARSGVFQKGDLENVSPKRLQRFFSKTDGSYRVTKSIRDTCIFAPHNVFSNPPFLKLDLVSCCNLMIYLKPVLQKRILAIFHYSLKPSGYLVLGKSEALGEVSSLFSQMEKKFRVFIRKNDVSSKVKFELSPRTPETRHSVVVPIQMQDRIIKINLERRVEDILLSKYVMASVLVNRDLDILQFHGPISSFIEITTGKASLNLLKLVKPGLVVDIRNTLHKVSRTNKTVRKSGIAFKHNDSGMKAAIEVVPVEGDGEKLFLIVFEKLQEGIENQPKATSRDQMVKRLQSELEATKEDMRSMLEEQEASNEELQSANEEIVSSNEELQSINEELETSKEEIESSVEELTTINNELQVRNEQLSEAQEYSQAIEETIREAVLVLDKTFRVRSANKSFYRIFRTTEEETEGNLIYELGNRQWDILELRQLLEELLAKQTLISGFEVEHDFPLIGHKIMLIHARMLMQKAQHTRIIVVAIEDITHHKLLQRAAQEREAWFRSVADNAPSIIWMCDQYQTRNFFNKTWFEFVGELQEDHRNISKSWEKYVHPEDIERYRVQFQQAFVEHQSLFIEFRLKRKDGEYRWMLDSAKPNYSPQGQFSGYVGTTTELHDRKLMMLELDKQVKERTQELKTINHELHRSNSELQQFAYVASHDLQEPLRKILTYIDRIGHSKGSMPGEANGYFEKIVDSALRMTNLIDDLLAFSSISFSSKKVIKVDLNSILRKVLADFDLLIGEKKAKVTVEQNLLVIDGEPMQLTQLFINLIGNSLKFAKDDVPLEIKVEQRIISNDLAREHKLDGAGQYVELTFSDNGIGFAPEYEEQIFVIFQRLNEKKKYPGTGIGLALCKKIVANHKGSIFARSLPDGASFHVILPIQQEQ
jgi:two-component system CheB/CheR fusion protein